MPTWLVVTLIAAGCWLALVGVWRWLVIPRLRSGPEGDPVTWLLWQTVRLFTRLVHRLEVTGREIVPDTNDPGPLVVVANHTGSVDPLLLQSACRFHIRWMMASETMLPSLDWLWKRQRAIPVDRDGADVAAAREAIRHLRGGGALGIFPEGGLFMPKGEIRPFLTGVGLIVARAKAPVLLAWISGTPDTTDLATSIATPSRARVHFVEIIDFEGERDAAAIARRLRERLAEASGWPLNDEPIPPPARPELA